MVDYPQNEFTAMIEQTAAENRSGVRGGVSVGTPLPTVQSADLGREVVEEPMSVEERAHFDALARAAGVVDPRLGNTEASDKPTAYASLEDAIAAGASVAPPPTADPVESRVSAREFIGRRAMSLAESFVPQFPRLPDFRKPEGIDLLRNVVMLDRMEFPITSEQALEFKRFVVDTARSSILDKLSEAEGLFESAGDGGGTDGDATQGATQEVQPQSEGSSAEPPQ